MTQTTPLPPPFLLADDRALDFLNSTALPGEHALEWIGDGAGLLDWLEAAGLVPDAVLARFRAAPEAVDAVAARARSLREWFRGFVAARAGAAVPADALPELEPLNGLLAQDSARPRIGADGGGLALRRERSWETPEALLQPLAERMASLVCDAGFATVRHCEGAGCSLWFRDTSARQTRRWCSMALCGNRAKAAAHRARLRERGEG